MCDCLSWVGDGGHCLATFFFLAQIHTEGNKEQYEQRMTECELTDRDKFESWNCMQSQNKNHLGQKYAYSLTLCLSRRTAVLQAYV